MKRYLFRELKVPLTRKDDVQNVLAETLKIKPHELKNLQVERFSLDSRKRGQPHFSYTLSFDCERTLHEKSGAVRVTEIPEAARDELENSNPVSKNVHIVGAGPAGLWAALTLLKKGFAVTLHEQGKPVQERFRDIQKFFRDRKFNAHSNVLFGEGGAGAFSDGKLNTRTRNFFSQQVLRDMVKLGMPREIMTFSKPHLGTDRLSKMLEELRRQILSLGGTFKFDSVFEDLELVNGEVAAAKFSGAWERTNALVLATGHSARSVYELLHERGVALEPKAFAVGVRVEHPQRLINERQLGRGVDTKLTGSAEYALTAKTLCGTSAAYSFCMCPGGVLVPCVSENERLATNGMSYSARNGEFANGAIVVPVKASADLFGGIEFQRKLEAKAFNLGGKTYSAPAQTIAAFLKNSTDKTLTKTSYECGITAVNLHDLLPSEIAASLAEGFENFERKIPGFIREGLIVAPETRTSSPVRITRNGNTLESVNTRGLFVLGEGAGYAGGIVTSAADGTKFAFRAKPQG